MPPPVVAIVATRSGPVKGGAAACRPSSLPATGHETCYDAHGIVIDYGRSLPSADPVFGARSDYLYWSSSTRPGNPVLAWLVGLRPGVSYDAKMNSYAVRAVRGPVVH